MTRRLPPLPSASRNVRPRPLLAVRLLGLLLGLALSLPLAAQTDFDPQQAGFSVLVQGEVCPYRVLGVYVMPREKVDLRVLDARPGIEFRLSTPGGRVQQLGDRGWTWDAPEAPGVYSLRIDASDPALSMVLNVFVMVPYGELKGDFLNGYRIGRYPDKPLRGLSIYRPPRGFIEVRPENESTRIAPHFTLKQFLCKQTGGYPKYVALRERLLLKLEYLLQAVNDKGWRTDSFVVISGFRTPAYNHAIGNVPYSRHQWGGAADIYIDEQPRNGVMDDLNGDGRSDERDAATLYDLIDALDGQPSYQPFIGGLGNYGRTDSHGPFVHVDARGFKARWGR